MMETPVSTFAVIAAMAGVTLIARWLGFYLIGFVQVGPRIEAAFQALPGAVVLATVMPIIAKEGISALVAILVAGFVARRGFGDFVAVVVSLGVAIAWRHFAY